VASRQFEAFMSILGHGDEKYRGSRRLSELAEWPDLCIEHRRIEAGLQSDLSLGCTEVVMTVSGRSTVRRTGNGDSQQTFAQPGTAWICPVGTYERNVELTEPIECLHIYLPPTLIESSALADYDIDPSKAELAYAGGFTDPTLHQIGTAFFNLLGRSIRPTDRLFVDGMRTALVACLLGNYSIDRWRRPTKAPVLDPKRLKRVLDFIDARLAKEISLDDLAAEACLSPFHFSRLFRDATGVSPHRFVTDLRVQAAQKLLALDHSSLVEIALDTGFGSQDNFTRVFRKTTGLTPGQYRELCRRG
jgi:AraC family transcriptional regulator